jgi:hypothetical protein
MAFIGFSLGCDGDGFLASYFLDDACFGGAIRLNFSADHGMRLFFLEPYRGIIFAQFPLTT